ncbi:MAG TPA: DUF4349 domain-containing protein [Acidimicrobiales bacterium]|nr:DUF4349 domain-containing protein [Acidimicrobiales bacterium]
MIDEDVLTEALGNAAEAIDIPEGATDRILAAARTSRPTTPSSRLRTLVPRSGRGRMILVAAVVILVAGAITLPLVGTRSNPSKTVAAGPARGPSVPSTTLPGLGSAGQGGAGSAGSPAPGTPSIKGATSSPATAPSPSVPPLPTGSVGQSAKVEAKGSVSLTIGDGKLASVMTKLTNLVAGFGGFVASSQAQVGPGDPSNPAAGTIVLQVPESSFASLLSQVQSVGHATSVTTTSTDVTGQVVDLQARISALQASRQQYLTILSKATTIGDILAVQSQLDSLQTQIEQLQGQLDTLNSETTYGTLTVSLAEAGRSPAPPPSPSTGLGKAWHDGVHGFVAGFDWLVRIAGPTLFVLLCLAALAVLGRFGWRAVRRRML